MDNHGYNFSCIFFGLHKPYIVCKFDFVKNFKLLVLTNNKPVQARVNGYHVNISKEDGKGHEWIQSSTTPDPRHHIHG